MTYTSRIRPRFPGVHNGENSDVPLNSPINARKSLESCPDGTMHRLVNSASECTSIRLVRAQHSVELEGLTNPTNSYFLTQSAVRGTADAMYASACRRQLTSMQTMGCEIPKKRGLVAHMGHENEQARFLRVKLPLDYRSFPPNLMRSTCPRFHVDIMHRSAKLQVVYVVHIHTLSFIHEM